MLLVLPATSASAERSSSALSLSLKIYSGTA